MRRINVLCVAVFLALLLLSSTSSILKVSKTLENRDLEFQVIDQGYISGYCEETYLVVRTEDEWAEVWEKHTTLHMVKMPYPEIIFSENIVVCAFMGERCTTGYSISVERIWTDEERIHVEITKCKPPEDAIVGEAFTYPYVFASFKRTELEIVFNITEEDGTIKEHILPEFTMVAITLTAFLFLSAVMVALKRKIEI